MTTSFVASNGTVIARKGRASLTVERPGTDRLLNINAERTDALREFFRAERDEELGRWRVPGQPNIVVYPVDDGSKVRVFDESQAYLSQQLGREVLTSEADPTSAVGNARAYFEAHPEPKPWHDAKPGEAWVLTVDGDEYAWGVGAGVDAGRFVYLGGLSNIPIDHPSITAGRCIWPEDAS